MQAIVAGTGIDKLDAFNSGVKRAETPYGSVDYIAQDDIIFVPRHASGHRVPPHLVNYKANAYLLKMLGVERAISIYAVGSITDRIKPTEFGLVDNFIDLSGRNMTFFDKEGEFSHTPMVNVFDRKLSDSFAKAALDQGYRIARNAIYASTNGPRLETKAEIRAFAMMGADVVGMTLATEATLLRELCIDNAAVAYSINWAAGLDAEGVSFLEDESIDRIADRILKIAVSALSV